MLLCVCDANIPGKCFLCGAGCWDGDGGTHLSRHSLGRLGYSGDICTDSTPVYVAEPYVVPHNALQVLKSVRTTPVVPSIGVSPVSFLLLSTGEISSSRLDAFWDIGDR